MDLSILTWNVWWRFDAWQARLKAILHVLQHTQPDVCCLQEVWSDSGGNLAQLLANDLGLQCEFFPTAAPTLYQRRLGNTDIGIGNAILSRWPIARSESEALVTADHEDEGRLIALAEIATPRGLLPVFTTHLNSGLTDSAVRVAQVGQIAAFMSQHASDDLPPILAGDFNCEPDADEIRTIVGRSKPPQPGFGLRDAWRLASGDAGATWSRHNPYVARTPQLPDSRIDYVFIGYPRQSTDLEISSCGLVGTVPVEGIWPSDHYGVSVNGYIRTLDETAAGAP
jgi:endonuclease/exonuclease/phosphatase family metal-dependent hydrolase